VSILSVVGIWVGSNFLLFGWLIWRRVLALPRRSFAEPTFGDTTLNQTSVVLQFAPRSPSARLSKTADASKNHIAVNSHATARRKSSPMNLLRMSGPA
jgi:hypothetical protein